MKDTFIGILEENIESVKQERLSGKSLNEIANQYGVTRDTVNYFARKHQTFIREYRNTDEEVRRKIDEKTNGRFVYISGYKTKESKIRVMCNECGKESELTFHHMTTARSKCIHCYNKKIEENRERKRLQKERERIIKIWDKVKGKQISFNVCIECGSVFLGSGRKYCSNKCRKKRTNRNKDNRLNIYNIVDKDITLTKLYQRDNGICYVCGIKCDWEDKITDDKGTVIVGSNYPTIEHIKPISSGGLHSWDNVKIACKKCNEKKSNIPLVAI